MTTLDLVRLAKRVKAHRLELYPSRVAAATAAGISKDTWRRVEEGKPVLDVKYAQIDRALGWVVGGCLLVAEGREPLLAGEPEAAPAPPAASRLSADAVRRAAFEAAREKLPKVPIGDIDAFGHELVEILRKVGEIENGD